MTQVQRLQPGDAANAARWDAFVMACPSATFFHRAGWQRVLRDSMRHDTHFLYCEIDGRIEGVLPLAHVRSFLFGSSLVSLPFAVYGGVAVQGYRAPSFSIGTKNLWAFDTLARAGYRYSSSIYPIHHDHYGMPDAPRFAHQVRAGVLEIPVTTLRMGGRNFPSSGGGYFRLLPYAMSRWMLRRVNQRDGQPAIFYFHPWEIDAGQPRVAGIDAKTRFRHYVNIDRMPARLEQLLRDFAWGRMDRIFLPQALH